MSANGISDKSLESLHKFYFQDINFIRIKEHVENLSKETVLSLHFKNFIGFNFLLCYEINADY